MGIYDPILCNNSDEMEVFQRAFAKASRKLEKYHGLFEQYLGLRPGERVDLNLVAVDGRREMRFAVRTPFDTDRAGELAMAMKHFRPLLCDPVPALVDAKVVFVAENRARFGQR